MKSTLYYIFIGIVVIISLLVGLTGHSLPWGRQLLALESASMVSTIPPGSLILIQDEPWYQAGDIVTFWAKVNNKEELVTHRIIAVGGNVYVTKGDDNQQSDRELVQPRLIEGRLVAFFPLLGRIILFLQSKPGLGLLMVPITLILYQQIRYLVHLFMRPHS